MSLERVWSIARLDLQSHVRSPLFGAMVLVACLFSMILNPLALIPSGQASSTNTPLFINSSYALAQLFCLSGFLLYTFFASMIAGMSTIRDDEAGVSDLLHSTPLEPREYVAGKLGGALIALGTLLAIHVLFLMAYLQYWPTNTPLVERGPFHVGHYVIPALAFVVPGIWLSACLAFTIGERTRKPLAVYAIPTILFMATVFIVFPPPAIDAQPALETLLTLLDPTGLRWLRHTALDIDRGAAFYNHSPLLFDTQFWLRTLLLIAVPFGIALTSISHCRALARGRGPKPRTGRMAPASAASTTPAPALMPTPAERAPRQPLAALRMTSARPAFLTSAFDIARAELRELRYQPGLYLFVVFAMLMVPEAVATATDPLGSAVMMTAGGMAVGTLSLLTLLGCFLLMFYSVESFERERVTGFDAILYSSPVRTGALMLGKGLGAAVAAGAVLVGSLAISLVLLFVQDGSRLDPWPLVAVWGIVLPATFFLWNAFIIATTAIVRERFTVYVIGLGTLLITFFLWQRGSMTWTYNWPLWGALRWSDMAMLDLNGRALLLNRATTIAMGVFLTAVAVQLFARGERDAGASQARLGVRSIARRGWRLAPFALLPLLFGTYLEKQVRAGFQSKSAQANAKAYWRQNIATWLDVETASITHVDLTIDLDPARRAATVTGAYTMVNHTDSDLRKLPFTVGAAFGEVAWTFNGQAISADDRSRLQLLTPERPIAPGETMEVGFAYRGLFPRGMTKNGGGIAQFVLPSGVALHTLRNSFLPTPGFVEGIGVDEGNRYDPPSAADQGIGRVEQQDSARPFTTRVTASAPSAYTVNSVGRKISEQTHDGRTTVVWESDYPVAVINIVAGRWDVRRQGDTAVFFHPRHDVNIDVILGTLVAAREHYSNWFFPYPWRELRLSEFPNHTTNAQGFPTNIPFSESIGFLTKPVADGRDFSMVTAHEAAHQWWGNVVGAGVGPGSAHLIEGMAHYSALLLQEAMNGERGRIELATQMERSYNIRRQATERPVGEMVDDQTPSDWTVVYEKGAWAMWMLQNHLGRTAMLDGLKAYVRAFHHRPRQPLTEDFFAFLRQQATDPLAYDAFVDQWFFDVVLPEFRLSDVTVKPLGDGWVISARVENIGTGDVTIEIAATRGERFADDGAYADQRTTVRLKAGTAQAVSWVVRFQPQKIVADPDALVLQRNRQQAVVDL